MPCFRPGSIPALLLAAACAGACSSGPASAPEGQQVARPQPYVPPPPEEPLSPGEVLFECERHLQAWSAEMAKQRDDENRETLEWLERSLARLVGNHRSILEQQAVSGPPRNRGIASAALGFLGDPAVLPLILNNVEDPDPLVSANAILGVARLAAPDTPLEPLHRLAQRRDLPEAVHANLAYAGLRLAQALGRDPGGMLSAMLIPYLDHMNPAIRSQAAIALGLIGASHAVPQLTQMLVSDEVPIVRNAAAAALGRIGAPGSASALRRALRDRDPLVAATARGSLAKIYGQDHGPDPEDWEEAPLPVPASAGTPPG